MGLGTGPAPAPEPLGVRAAAQVRNEPGGRGRGRAGEAGPPRPLCGHRHSPGGRYGTGPAPRYPSEAAEGLSGNRGGRCFSSRGAAEPRLAPARSPVPSVRGALTSRGCGGGGSAPRAGPGPRCRGSFPAGLGQRCPPRASPEAARCRPQRRGRRRSRGNSGQGIAGHVRAAGPPPPGDRPAGRARQQRAAGRAGGGRCSCGSHLRPRSLLSRSSGGQERAANEVRELQQKGECGGRVLPAPWACGAHLLRDGGMQRCWPPAPRSPSSASSPAVRP